MRLFILALVVLCAHATPQHTKTAGVKGGYSGRGYQGGENLVNNFYINNTQHQVYAGYAVRTNMSESVNYERGVCYIEVPTASLVKDPAHVPAGNGSRPDLSRIRSCCTGYIRSIHNYRICEPVCTHECINGLCIAPETCTCYPDHVRNLAGFCVATCPIGCQNGQCAGGECICKDGYRLDSESKFCVPYCRDQCGGPGRGNCTAPNVCDNLSNPSSNTTVSPYGQHPNHNNQSPPGVPYGQRPINPNYPGSQPNNYPGGPQSNYPGGPQTNYPGGPQSNYPGGPQTNYPGGSQSNYPGGPQSNYPGGPQSIYPGGPQTNYPGGPQTNYPGGPQTNYPGGPQTNHPSGSQTNYPGGPQPNYPGGPQSNYPGGPQTNYPGGPQYNYTAYPNVPGSQNQYPGVQPGNITGNPYNLNSQHLSNSSQLPSNNVNGQPIYTHIPGHQPSLYPDSQHLGPDQRPNQGNLSPNSSQPLPNGAAFYPNSQYYPGTQYYPYNPNPGYQPMQRPNNAESLYPNSQNYPGQQNYPYMQNNYPNQPYQPNYASHTPGSEYQHIYPNSQMSAVELLCSVPCVNGTCVGRDVCACNTGYVPIAGDTSRCEPHCLGCSNGVCVSPYVCHCNPGYFKDFSVKGRSPCVRRIRRSADASAPVNIADLLVFEIRDDYVN